MLRMDQKSDFQEQSLGNGLPVPDKYYRADAALIYVQLPLPVTTGRSQRPLSGVLILKYVLN